MGCMRIYSTSARPSISQETTLINQCWNYILATRLRNHKIMIRPLTLRQVKLQLFLYLGPHCTIRKWPMRQICNNLTNFNSNLGMKLQLKLPVVKLRFKFSEKKRKRRRNSLFSDFSFIWVLERFDRTDAAAAASYRKKVPGRKRTVRENFKWT